MRRMLSLVAVGIIFLVAVSNVSAADPFKVGFVFAGSVSGDHGWTHQHNAGRLALEEALGDQVRTTYVELDAEGVDPQQVIGQLAAAGHQLIFTTFGDMNNTIKVARNFPDTYFEICSGAQRADNVATYLARFYEGRYVTGRIAGAVTQTDTIGYIASYPIPEVIRGINSFTLGLRRVNTNATVKVIWVNSWSDPELEGDAAKTLIDLGADVLVQHTGSAVPTQMAEAHGVWAFGQASDLMAYGPNAHLTAIVNNWGPYYIKRTKAAMAGSWTAGDFWGGMDADMIRLAEINPQSVPAAVIADAQATVAGLRSGEIHPFTGPIMDQTGNEIVGPGVTLTDGDLLEMNYYVMGVEGVLPN